MGRYKSKDPLQLTPTEEKFMTVLWKIKEGTVRDVMANLPDDQLAYTSVSTILRILEQKGSLTSQKQGQTHLYQPAYTKDRYEKTTLKKVVDNVFDKAPTNLMATLINSEDISKSDLIKIREMIDDNLSD